MGDWVDEKAKEMLNHWTTAEQGDGIYFGITWYRREQLATDIAAALRDAAADARKQAIGECAEIAEGFRAGEDINAQTTSGFWGRRIAAAIRARQAEPRDA